MIYLHKILPLLLSPLAIVLFLVFLGALRKSRKLVLFGALLLYLCSMPYLSDKLFRLIEESALREPVATMPTTEAIVVLSGMLIPVESTHGTAYEWRDPDRFFGGIELFKAKKANKLIFTNGWQPWMTDSLPEGIVLKQYAEKQGIPGEHILITENVLNTEEDAIAVKKLLPKENTSITLVTSAFHMPRAKLLFEQQGFSVTTFPVDFKVEKTDNTLMKLMPSAYALHLTTVATREMMGKAYYQLRIALKSIRK